MRELVGSRQAGTSAVTSLLLRCTLALEVLLLVLAAGAPGSALMVRRSLNDLVGESSLIAVGTVTDQRCEMVDGHIMTRVRLTTEHHAQLGDVPSQVEFVVSGGQIGNRLEWVSDTPSFGVGERVLVMLRPADAHELVVTSQYQGKFLVTEGDRINRSTKALRSLLSEIGSIRNGTAKSEIETPDLMPSPDEAEGALVAITCCGYLTDDTYGYDMRWCVSPCCPTIHFRIYPNCYDVTCELDAILRAVDSWNAVPCSCAMLTYDGTYPACSWSDDGNNVVCWDNLASGIIGRTRVYAWRSAGETRWTIDGFDMKFNADYTWSCSCEPGKMDIETVALHEFGHVLAMVDQYSLSCSDYVMYGYGGLGDCRHDPDPCTDGLCLNGLYDNAVQCCCSLTMQASPAGGGTTDPAQGDHQYTCGTLVPICATPAPEYTFDHWQGDVTSPGSACTTVTLDVDKTVTAVFVESGEWDCSTDVPKAIPDSGSVVSELEMTDVGAVADVDVKLTIMHTWDADLNVFLESPDGTLVELFTGVGSSGDNFVDTVLDDEAAASITAGAAPFTGSYRPEGLLSVLDGKDAAGTWKLRVTDDTEWDTGTLESWCLRLSIEPPEICSTDVPKAIADLDTVVSELEIETVGTIKDVDVTLTIMHTWDSDLDVFLEAPDGTQVELFTDVGSSGDNFVDTVLDDEAAASITAGAAPFTGSYRPEGLLSVLDGKDAAGTWKLRVTDDAGGDAGTLESWCLRLSIDPWVCSTDVPKAIPDLGAAVSALEIGAVGTITDVDVKLTIMHTWDADLDVFLESPDGTLVELFTDVGGSGDNFVDTVLDDEAAASITAGAAPFTGSYRPEGLLSDLDGKDASGIWKLRVTDDAGGDMGALESWCLRLSIEPRTEICSTDVPNPIPDLGTVVSTLEVADLGAVADMDVKLTIMHTWDADLDVFLESPEGTLVELFTDVGGSGNNFVDTVLDDEAGTSIAAGTAPFTGSYRSEGLLSDLDGESITGTWKLSVTDDEALIEGTLESWCLRLLTKPTAPLVTDDGAYTLSTSEIHASWSAEDSVSGIAEYQYAVSTSTSEADIIPGGAWLSVGLLGEDTRGGCSLLPGQVYYVLVKAANNSGFWSDIGVSDGITVVVNTVSIDAAKLLPEASSVGLASDVVTAIFGSYFYIEEPSRWAGIRVDPIEMPSGLTVGDMADVGGTIQTNTDGECCVGDGTVASIGSGGVDSLGLTSRDLGGGPFGLQEGIAGAVGLNNIGLLVRIWGNLTYADAGYFYLDDGSALHDGSGHAGVKVLAAGMTICPSEWCLEDVSKAIPDLGTVVSTLEITDVGTIADVDVKLTIMHTRDADLDVFLEGPDGTLVELFTDVGGSADNLIDTVFDDECATPIILGSAPFTGCYRPEGLLSDLDGKSITGIWKLWVTDDAPGDTGTLESWCLRLTIPLEVTGISSCFKVGDALYRLIRVRDQADIVVFQ